MGRNPKPQAALVSSVARPTRELCDSAFCSAAHPQRERQRMSEQGPARFWLERSISNVGGKRRVAFVMLNPSTADDTNDDPTIRRCKGFAASWGFSDLIVVNTNPMRSTNPKRTPEPTEFDLQENDEYLRRAAFWAELVV